MIMPIQHSVIYTAALLLISATTLAQEDSQITLESNFIGDKEQPSVSYFIPWQEIGAPDKLLWHPDQKYDKTLELVDRDVLLRATRLYKNMQLESDLTLTDNK